MYPQNTTVTICSVVHSHYKFCKSRMTLVRGRLTGMSGLAPSGAPFALVLGGWGFEAFWNMSVAPVHGTSSYGCNTSLWNWFFHNLTIAEATMYLHRIWRHTSVIGHFSICIEDTNKLALWKLIPSSTSICIRYLLRTNMSCKWDETAWLARNSGRLQFYNSITHASIVFSNGMLSLRTYKWATVDDCIRGNSLQTNYQYTSILCEYMLWGLAIRNHDSE